MTAITWRRASEGFTGTPSSGAGTRTGVGAGVGLADGASDAGGSPDAGGETDSPGPAEVAGPVVGPGVGTWATPEGAGVDAAPNRPPAPMPMITPAARMTAAMRPMTARFT